MEQYIKPFVSVCEMVFRDFCQTEVTAGRVFFVTKDEYESNWDISGIIGLSGEASGAVAISLKSATAFKITNLLTGSEHNHIDMYVTDAIGEIINIIAGNVKKHFEDDLRIKISLPSIIKGRAHSIVWPSEKTRIICIPFTVFGDQEFCLSIAVDPTK
ncbi:MAG: chemotaxis protein CheX [Spirochaetaceae bacterium]|nr:chemotaxis protein CheX [Spirochaetaceae bacterium]